MTRRGEQPYQLVILAHAIVEGRVSKKCVFHARPDRLTVCAAADSLIDWCASAGELLFSSGYTAFLYAHVLYATPAVEMEWKLIEMRTHRTEWTPCPSI